MEVNSNPAAFSGRLIPFRWSIGTFEKIEDAVSCSDQSVIGNGAATGLRHSTDSELRGKESKPPRITIGKGERRAKFPPARRKSLRSPFFGGNHVRPADFRSRAAHMESNSAIIQVLDSWRLQN